MPDWDEILRLDGPAVWRTAYRIVGNRADADECFQEAFLAAWKVARRTPVRHWQALLKRLVTARAVDRLRSRLRQRSHEASTDWEALPGAEPSPSKTSEDEKLSTDLREALAGLPPKQATAFCLQVLDDCTYVEISDNLAETTDAVGVLLHRARQRLRRFLSSSPASEKRS